MCVRKGGLGIFKGKRKGEVGMSWNIGEVKI